VEAYRDWLIGRGYSATTVHWRTYFAHARLTEWGTWERTPVEVAEWLAKYESWTRGTYHNHLVSLYKYLTEIGLLEVDPMARIRRPPSPKPRPKPLSDEQLVRVLATPTGSLRAWLLLASKAGLRLHEVAKVRGEDVDDFGLTVCGKGGKTERLPMHPLLRELAGQYPTRGHWFPSPWGGRDHISSSTVYLRVTQHFRACEITEGGIHRLRHTYGTQLVRAGTPINVVQSLMRHSNLNTTQLYLGVDEDERAAAIGRI
jgi:integrase/recombinase XerD